MKLLFKRILKEEKGQGMVEYGLIIALVAVVAMAGLVALSGTDGVATHPEGTGLKGLIARIKKGLTPFFSN